MRQLIGKSTTKNSLSMISVLQLSTDSPHPCKMSWSIIKRTIVPWPINIDVTYFPQSRFNMALKKKQTISRISPLLERPLYSTATDTLGPQGKIRQDLGMVSSTPTKDPTIIRLIATVPSTNAFLARRQEYPSKSICRIVLFKLTCNQSWIAFTVRG